MSNYFETITNVETGETTTREYTKAEIEEFKKREAEFLAEYAKIQAEEAEKNLAREAILNKLGLTAEEAAILLG